ncbi:hypothetical protein RMN56_14425 [Micromonospora halotolerans]|uniref:Rho termination factor N-terminal domain-containing protein n=1 Tax=Micromonospora halotolerans TaxID=709879 RepID=A0ABZ0A4G2_9ACTN|nr:hypothetical protein [Micromonospora halotolerans]WNM42451.1 hypothetical protein RMN56_14425 [Micromonospora halotolerans]
MAQRNSSSRGTTATKRKPGNQTANTPGINESEISRMKVDDIRGQLRRRGVSGISAMRKPDLVKTMVRTLRSEQGGAARKSTGPAGRPSATKKTAAAKKTTAARRTAPSRAKAAPAAKATGARAKAAPAKKTAGTRAKAAPARKTAGARAKAAPAKKTAGARAKAAPAKKAAGTRAKAAPARKAAGARAVPAKRAAGTRAKAAPARKAAAAPGPALARGTAATTTQIRSGRSASRSVGSSQQIMSLDDRPERPGRSLVTTNHEVIQRWARARNAKPATIAGTERDDRPGVLTFNIPGYRESSRIREVSWDDWFRTFDLRGLNLIYQEQMRDGRQSNFFRTENPNREDG